MTSLTVTHHKDLLEVPLRRFEAFSEPRLQGTTAYRTCKEVWGAVDKNSLFRGWKGGEYHRIMDISWSHEAHPIRIFEGLLEILDECRGHGTIHHPMIRR